MTTRSILLRATFMAAVSLFATAPEKVDAFWYGYGYQPYYTGYAPSYGYGWGYRPLLNWRINRLERREARLDYRSDRLGNRAYSGFGGGYYGGASYGVASYGGYYGDACGCGVSDCGGCGSCGVTTVGYGPVYGSSCCNTCGYSYDMCGCSSCGCSSGECGASGCPGGNCSAGSSSSTIVNSPPSNAEPTPVRPRAPRETTPTYDPAPTNNNSDLNNRAMPNDGFRPNTTPGGGMSDPLPDDFSSPMPTNPANPATPGRGIDFGLDPVNPATPGPADGPGTLDSFRPAPTEVDDALPPDDSAALPNSDRTLKFSAIDSDLELVRVSRERTQVRARYRVPQMVARSLDVERNFAGGDTQIASSK